MRCIAVTNSRPGQDRFSIPLTSREAVASRGERPRFSQSEGQLGHRLGEVTSEEKSCKNLYV